MMCSICTSRSITCKNNYSLRKFDQRFDVNGRTSSTHEGSHANPVQQCYYKNLLHKCQHYMQVCIAAAIMWVLGPTSTSLQTIVYLGWILITAQAQGVHVIHTYIRHHHGNLCVTHAAYIRGWDGLQHSMIFCYWSRLFSVCCDQRTDVWGVSYSKI